MQTFYQDKNEELFSRETSIVGAIICARRIGRCVKEEHNRKFRK